ncbi:hypothetical protein [Lachnotalea sp. AF33-28]|nr:hypothetical protein [Lachnotalea sp. AF33-28]
MAKRAQVTGQQKPHRHGGFLVRGTPMRLLLTAGLIRPMGYYMTYRITFF